MAAEILLLFYGLCAWGAALNFPAWTRLAWKSWRDPARIRPWWNDTFMMARFGIMLLAGGTSGLAGVRTVASLFGREALAVPSPVGILCIAVMAAAEPLFLRVDEVHARRGGYHSIGWRLYWIGAIVWCATVALIWWRP